MNCQEHNYYYYYSLSLFKTELGYIKGQIQILDIYDVSGSPPPP